MNKAHIKNTMDFDYPKFTMTYGHVIYFGAKFQKNMKKGSRWILVWAHSLINLSF